MSNKIILPSGLHFIKGKFTLLFLSLVAVLLLVPSFLDDISAAEKIGFTLDLVLITGVYAVSYKRSLWVIALLLALPGIILSAENYFNFIAHGTYSKHLLVAGLALKLAFFSFTATAILVSIMKQSEVTVDTIFGSFCVYILIALAFAYLYGLFEMLWQPSSFRFPPHENFLLEGIGETSAKVPQLIYFSIVTLTTLGYGDITPVDMTARYFSAFEAMVGQLYIAVLVARLVGLHISSQKK